MKSSNAVFLSLLVVCLVPPAQGAYVLNVTQNGPNVVASGSGTINTTALTETLGMGAFAEPGMYPGNANITVGQTSGVNYWSPISGPSNFGSGPPVTASSGAGNLVQLAEGIGALSLPVTYVSGSATSGTATFNNTTIVALGLTPGTYTYTWGSGSNADSFTLTIGGSPTGTPAPSSLYLAAIALAILAAWQVIRLRRVYE